MEVGEVGEMVCVESQVRDLSKMFAKYVKTFKKCVFNCALMLHAEIIYPFLPLLKWSYLNFLCALI